MNDGSWVKVGEDTYCNLALVSFIEEADDATILSAGAQGPADQQRRVTDQSARRQIHSFVEQHAAKALQTAGAGAARY